MFKRKMLVMGTAGLLALTAAPMVAHAQAAYDFDLPSQPLADTLRAIGARGGVNVVFQPAAVQGKLSPPLKGSYSPQAAVEQVLAGSGLTDHLTAGGSLIVDRPGPQVQGAQDEPRATAVAEVLVTGSRIRGAAPSSPVQRYSQQQIVDSGQTDLGQLVRSLPQSFSGGQNPGVTLGPSAGGLSNQNISSASSINLRGLGPDATLTLLNGRRLSYDSFTQAVDISSIPLAAVDQVQILLDGASALYGSDAVAGVANVILKRDYDGLNVTARFGAATDGGDDQQNYSIVGGKRWDTGGFIATYSYGLDSGLMSNQRPYTRFMASPNSLYPYMISQNVLFSGHQDLASFAHFGIDALYNDRSSNSALNEHPYGRYFEDTANYEFVVAPNLSFDLGRSWTLSLNGTVGDDRSTYVDPHYTDAGAYVSATHGCYCNTSQSAEIDGVGPLFQAPAGPVQLALGAGYHRDGYKDNTESGSRSNGYGFGELNLPIVSPAMDIPYVRSLSLNASYRYEHYSDFSGVGTPKVGLVWAPTDDVDIKATWGQSFKAPTLLQAFEERIVYLYPSIYLGQPAAPPTSAALIAYGGNQKLSPERANTLTAGFVVHPVAVPGFTFEFSYFHIDYTNRVAQPLNPLSSAFSNPAFVAFVHYNPTVAQQQALIAQAPSITNLTGGAYNAANVEAIIDDVYTNVASETYDGVDLSARYSVPFHDGRLAFIGSASWLTGHEQLTPGTPEIATVGTIYNPPNWHARGGVVWTTDTLTAAAYANYVGGLTDTRTTPHPQGASQTTFDASVGYRIKAGPYLLRNSELRVSAMNLFDARPPYLASTSAYIPAYDSSNYSAIGRLVTVSISKDW